MLTFLLIAIISRSYCYTVWSAIGVILSSVYLSVMLCILALRVGVQTGLKVVPACS